MNHTQGARDGGITAAYVGHVREDAWKRRLDAGFEDDFGPELAAQPYKRPRRQPTAAVTQMAEELGLNPDDRQQRLTAARTSRDRQRAEWVSQSSAQGVYTEDTEDPDSSTDLANESLDGIAVGPQLPLARSTTGSADTPHRDGTRSTEDDESNESLDEGSIDPRLLSLGQLIAVGSDDIDAAFTTIDSVLPDLASDPPDSHFPITEVTFVSKFSKCNDYRYERLGDTLPVGAASGGSRDPPSRWQYKCTKTPACQKTFPSRYLRDHHAENCDPTSQPERAFACTQCSSRFDEQSALQAHMKTVHEAWVPVGCGENGCTSTEIFQTRRAFTNHRSDFHSDWMPQACPLSPDRGVFMVRRNYAAHIDYHHSKEKAKLMPPKKKTKKRASIPATLSWQPSKCQYPGCKSAFVYETRDKYINHLRLMHGVKAKESTPYMPTSTPEDEENE